MDCFDVEVGGDIASVFNKLLSMVSVGANFVNGFSD